MACSGGVRVSLEELMRKSARRGGGGAKGFFVNVYVGIESGAAPSRGLVGVACLARTPSPSPVKPPEMIHVAKTWAVHDTNYGTAGRGSIESRDCGTGNEGGQSSAVS